MKAHTTVLAAIHAILSRSSGKTATVVIDSVAEVNYKTSPAGTVLVTYHIDSVFARGEPGSHHAFAVPRKCEDSLVSWSVRSDHHLLRGREGELDCTRPLPADLPMGAP